MTLRMPLPALDGEPGKGDYDDVSAVTRPIDKLAKRGTFRHRWAKIYGGDAGIDPCAHLSCARCLQWQP